MSKACILCGSNHFEPLFGGRGWRLHRCRGCGLVKTEAKSFLSYRKYHRDQEYQEFESQFRNIFLKRFYLVKKFVDFGRILDIGCSTGTLLSLFKKDGWEVWGIEPSQSATIAEKRGIIVKKTTFEKVDLPQNYFDVVILNHTLEHLANPLEVVKKVKAVLKNGGLILIDVPNFGGFSARILRSRWPYLVPDEHTYQFTQDSLKKILKKAGFRYLFSESRSGIFDYGKPLAEILGSLLSLKKRFFADTLGLPGALMATVLNQGSSLSMIGKKASRRI